MNSEKAEETCDNPSSKKPITTGHDGKPPRRAKSVYDALNVLGHSVNSIYGKITRKSSRKHSSQSLSDLHLASAQDSHKINSNRSLNSSTSDLRDTPYVFKPAPTISDISEGTFSSEDGDDEMEVHWQDLSSLESNHSHNGQSGSGDDSTVPSIPKRKFSHRKISSENKSIASSKWIESATAEMESILINGREGIPEIVEDDDEKKLKPTLKIRHDAPRKTISFEAGPDDKNDDSQSDTDSACDIPKHKSYRTARKNSMAPPKAFRRTKSVDPQ